GVEAISPIERGVDSLGCSPLRLEGVLLRQVTIPRERYRTLQSDRRVLLDETHCVAPGVRCIDQVRAGALDLREVGREIGRSQGRIGTTGARCSLDLEGAVEGFQRL